MTKKVILFYMILLLVTANSSFIFAQKNKQTKSTARTNIQAETNLFQYDTRIKEPETPGYFGLFFKTILIIGIFGYGIYFLFKYISQKQGLHLPNLEIIRLITSLPVGTNRFIQIIEMGSQYFLIGSTDSNITLLKEITDKDTINRILILKSKKPELTEQLNFTHFVKNIIQDISKKINTKDAADFLKKQKDRLNRLHIRK